MKKENLLANIGLLLFRVAISAAMITHGWPKFLQLIGPEAIEFTDPFGIGHPATLFLTVVGELLAPILIIIGFKTKFSAIPAAFTMAVAFFIIHAPDPFGDKEMSFLYFIAFTTIAILGAGKFSVDGNIKKK